MVKQVSMVKDNNMDLRFKDIALRLLDIYKDDEEAAVRCIFTIKTYPDSIDEPIVMRGLGLEEMYAIGYHKSYHFRYLNYES